MMEYSNYIKTQDSNLENSKEDFKAYDELPKELKSFIQNYSLNIDCRGILKLIENQIPTYGIINILKFEEKIKNV